MVATATWSGRAAAATAAAAARQVARSAGGGSAAGGPDSMDGLPDEVVHRILLLVDLKDLGPVAAVASRYRLGVSSVLKAEGSTLLREGMELFRGDNFRVVNTVRGQALARAAAAGGLPLAVAQCRYRRWGGHGSDGDDLAAATRCFQQVAAGGGPGGEASWIVQEAESMLGECYHHGEGVEQDLAESAEWFQKAAELGHSDAQCHLGNLYHHGEGVDRDDVEAAKWFRKAAGQGASDAQCYLGELYYDGEGVEQDFAEAAKWYQKATEQGDSDAQCRLGMCYDSGEGVEQDHVQAAKWYRKAAEQGDSDAQCNLGGCYRDGEGVELDVAEAVVWYEKAAAQGNTIAIEALDSRIAAEALDNVYVQDLGL